MDTEIWQQLLSLESRDAIDRMFSTIHGRELSARRAKEISAAARQAREFFRSASGASLSVRPLLTFYGVASLARSLTLLLRKHGGEECLTRGHGLETVDWSSILSGDLSIGLAALGNLKVRTCAGTFSDLVAYTKNLMCMHVRSAAVDWRLAYPVPSLGDELSMTDLLERSPDLRTDYEKVGAKIRYAAVSEMAYSTETGLLVTAPASDLCRFQQSYVDAGYEATLDGQMTRVTAPAILFNLSKPQFMHSYVQKMFNSIPNLHIVEPFPGLQRYSQIAVTYLLSYYLGMLARYYPTYWISLMQGEKGDTLWPTLNRAQHLVERAFPELTIELITSVIKDGL